MAALSNPRYEDHEEILGSSTLEAMRSSRVLVVGAGGIGCELLKNLVLGGFENIEVIDMDTIDLSNLNRQFLFRHHHIGSPKSIVARESALAFNPLAKIVAHHANIKEARFGVSFFQQFSLVMNALDNLDARRHVNRLCLAADVPLIESGTAGFLGQVQFFQKGKTDCFECSPKPVPKTYASCTINNTPSKPIHCIVWAKAKLGDLFDPQSDGASSSGAQPVDVGGAAAADGPSSIWQDPQIVGSQQLLQQTLEQRGFSHWAFQKLFATDISVQRRVGELSTHDIWKGQPPPEPVSLSELLDTAAAPSQFDSGASERSVWSLDENARVFLQSVEKLQARGGPVSFDKDDAETLDFVVSASNVRSHQFSIPLQSRFEAKALAGSIIPAIATTNAIIAGLIVIEAVKYLSQKPIDQMKCTYLLKRPSRNRLLIPLPTDEANPSCFVCGMVQFVSFIIPSLLSHALFLFFFFLPRNQYINVKNQHQDHISSDVGGSSPHGRVWAHRTVLDDWS